MFVLIVTKQQLKRVFEKSKNVSARSFCEITTYLHSGCLCERTRCQNNLPPPTKRCVHLNPLIFSASHPDSTVLSAKPQICSAVFRKTLGYSEQDVNGSSEIRRGRLPSGGEGGGTGRGLNRKACIIYPKLKLIRSDSSLSPVSAS